MKHLDLFSGIGGFAVAAEATWEDVEHVFVEYDPFCQAVLRKHWPEAEIHGDIREFVADANSQRKLQSKGIEQDKRQWSCDLVTGGFPCQPFSSAGRRRGTTDDRYLWPAMLEAITLFKPTWIIAENVAGLVTWNEGLVLETVCSDLEAEGYEVQPFIIPAVAVGAPHRRDRVWIVAHKIGKELREQPRRGGWPSRQSKALSREHNRHAAHSSSPRLPDDARRELRGLQETAGAYPRRQSGRAHATLERWTEDWPEVAAKLCTLDDGLPPGLVRPRGWRNAALKAAGNAIVPQVAAEIMRAMR